MYPKNVHQKSRHIKFKRAAKMEEITKRNFAVENRLNAGEIQSSLKNIDLAVHKVRVQGDQDREYC